MVNYQNGKIYKIVLDECDEIYVGSTTKTLSQRMSSHRAEAKKTPIPAHSFINEYGWDKAHIILIEDYPCERKEQLNARERYWIEQIGTLNKTIPTRTKKEWSEQNIEKCRETDKNYREINKDIISEKKSKYYYENIDKIREYKREYYRQNADKLNEYKRQWREKKKEKQITMCV